MCKPCGNRARAATPEFRAAVTAGNRRALQDPEFYARKCKIARRNAQKAALDPELRAKSRELALANLQKAFTPEAQQRRVEAIAAARGKQTDKRLAWCPLEFRALHHRNVQSKRMTAAESRRQIEAVIADHEALSVIDGALSHLRHYAPVEILENGYRYGNAILTPAEVVERAKLRGWQPERWAA